ncbi:hypothetical protein PoB_000707600 [Plakobranchus ocellatus]|uniref:Uncharacterized protein n=1 Tax=Plakobranchus ocellatus TaxID=259542 RepID=A0AAV3Y033_9GAST|nr:hypothetical protein PoB_000707600 [Plakobranchus ocellatus]
MATSNDLLIKQRSLIELLAAEGCSAANKTRHTSTTLTPQSLYDTQRGQQHIHTKLNTESATTCSQDDRPRLFSTKNKIGVIPLLQKSRQSIASSGLPLSRGLTNQSQHTHTKYPTMLS